MRKSVFFALMLLVCGLYAGDPIGGFWKAVDDETGNPQCIVAVYEYQGKYYGRMVASYDDHGKINDTIYAPKGRAPGVLGNPFYCGLDFIWNLRDKGEKYRGKIMDPREGGIYNAELWIRDGILIVRGELLFFGRNEKWLPVYQKDLPKGFKLPDVKKFVPVIPESN